MVFKIDSFLFIISLEFFSIIFLNFLLPINAYLTTSPRPDLYSSSDRVPKKEVEISNE